MIPLRLDEAAGAAGGRLLGGEPGATVTSVVVDSRRAGPGALFVALRGERDGHDFAADALARGAVAAVVGRDVGARPAVVVEDTLAALARLATASRDRLGARVVAVTGSSGKTVTKELTAAACASRLRVVAGEASFNNEIGVPLTVLRAAEDTEALVVEVGSRGVGHIAALMPVVRPDVGIVTNVGLAHVGMFGSPEAIAQAKGELVEALPRGGAAVLNADDPVVAAMRARTRAGVVTFGLSEAADVRGLAVVLDRDGRARFEARAGASSAPVALGIAGAHMVSNALAAIAAAGALGVPLADAAAALGGVAGLPGRMEVLEGPGGWRVINDSYNANPQSTVAALRTLVSLGAGRRTWAVLGTMAELGEASALEHEGVGRAAAGLGVSRVVAVGEEARPVLEGARAGGMGPEAAAFARDRDEAIDILLGEVAAGDVVLVKASRAAGLEAVAERVVKGP